MISDSGSMIKFLPPCSEIKRMNVELEEMTTNVKGEEFMYSSTKGKLNDEEGWFRVRVKFSKEFKEFKKVRAYNAQSLVGNAGGYVGLLVGYAIVEFPRMIASILRYFL